MQCLCRILPHLQAGPWQTDMVTWTWAAASARGTSHEKTGAPCQDCARSFLVGERGNETFVAIICDGAGSAAKAAQGAAFVVRDLSRRVRLHWSSEDRLPDDTLVASWVSEVRSRLFALADARELLPRDFACTLVIVISSGDETVIGHIGDGAVVVRDACDQSWSAVSWPAHGEYASTTHFLIDVPEPRLTLTRHKALIDSVAAFTDGIERLALNFTDNCAHAPFFNGVLAPVEASSASGRDDTLSLKLRSFLNSDAVNSRTDDDKTLVVAVRR